MVEGSRDVSPREPFGLKSHLSFFGSLVLKLKFKGARIGPPQVLQSVEGEISRPGRTLEPIVVGFDGSVGEDRPSLVFGEVGSENIFFVESGSTHDDATAGDESGDERLVERIANGGAGIF